MRFCQLLGLLAVIGSVGCGHKKPSTQQAAPNAAISSGMESGSKNAPPVPLPPGMTSYLRDMNGVSSASGNFNPVINPNAGISMVVPPGFEWSNAENVLAAFSNVIGMRESYAQERHSPIHVFYALPDLLGEIKYTSTLDVDTYEPMDYQHYLGQIKASKFNWTELSPIMTSMGLVPVHERTQDGTETYSNGNPQHFKVIIRQYALCWNSALVVVSTVYPEPMSLRLRGNLEQAIGSIRLIPKAQGELVLPPEGPKASHYTTRGAGNYNPSFAPPRRDPLDEMRQVNEFNRQNQQRGANQPIQEAPPATNQKGAGDQNAPPTTPPTGQEGGAANEQKAGGN